MRGRRRPFKRGDASRPPNGPGGPFRVRRQHRAVDDGPPPGAKFLLVLAIAFLLPLALHHFLILRRPALGFLFNGRRLAGRARAMADATPGAGREAAPGVSGS
jgi:hypothetical protein